MDSLAAIFAGSFLVAFSGAAMPGPMLTVVIRESVRRGAVAGPLVVMGHTLLEIATLAAILAGLGSVMAKPLFFGVTGLVGGSILVWMGLGMIRSLKSLTLDFASAGPGGMNPVLGGVVTSASNPYFALWWATAGLTLLGRASGRGVEGQAVFFIGHTLADLVWYSAVSLMVRFGRSFLTDKCYRTLVSILASFLIFFGCYFAFDGSRKLLSLS